MSIAEIVVIASIATAGLLYGELLHYLEKKRRHR